MRYCYRIATIVWIPLLVVGGCSSSDSPEEPTANRAPIITSLTASPDAISEGSTLRVTAKLDDAEGPDDIVGGELFDDRANSYGSFAGEPPAGTYAVDLTWEAINAALPIDTPMGGGQRILRAVFTDRQGLEAKREVTVKLRCKTDGALGLCGGQCVDLAGDLSNCQACGRVCPDTDLEHAHPVCGGDGCDVACDPGYVWESDRCVRAGWRIETIAEVGDNDDASYNALQIDRDDRPHVSYLNNSDFDLFYGRRTDSGWQIDTVDASGDVGRETSLALDSEQRPHIAYSDTTNQDLKYAFNDGSSWTVTTVDAEGAVGNATSLVLDASDRPHIAYRDATDPDETKLKYARLDGSQWRIEVVDQGGKLAAYPSIVIDAKGEPWIAYRDVSANAVKLATRSADGGWKTEVIDEGGSAGWYLSLQLDGQDRPHLVHFAFFAAELRYLRWDGAAWQKETIDSGGGVGVSASFKLDSQDRPHVAYFDIPNGDLKYQYRDGSGWQIEVIEDAADDTMGGGASLALGSHDLPHVVYLHYDSRELRYATIPAAP